MMKRLLSSICISLVLIGQTGFAGLALAADDPAPSPEPTPVVSPSPSPEPEASPTPEPAPEATPSPTPAASPSPTPQAIGASNTGPGEPTGTVPEWVFDTVSGRWVEADKDSFTYDKASGYWLSPKYYYDTRIGWYKIIPASEPKPDYLITGKKLIHTAWGDLEVGSPQYRLAQLMGVIGPDGQPTGSAAIAGSGADSNNQIGITNSSQTWFDLTNLINVITILQAAAKSGDVSATGNTQVGDAVTGAAAVIANLINLLASAWSWSSGDLSFFMHNFFGNHNGDLTLAPTQTTNGGGGGLGSSASIDGSGSGSNNDAGVSNNSDLAVNARSEGSITNNVDLLAQSGDAVANQNNQAGDVRSGSAFAQINIINMINSFINSGSSFFGILNIFGDFNGDILFPKGFLDSLFGGSGGDSSAGLSNTGSGSTNQAGVSNSTNANINNTSDYSLNNNIQTSAQSGDTTLADNSRSGNGGTGASNTTNSLFNMVNSSIFGDNAVLVIVNVMGRWVGRIMALPGGSSQTALLTSGGRVSQNATGADSQNNTSVNNNSDATVNQSSVGNITNNVRVHAQSGDAQANQNTEVGDVATGEAKAASSVVNIVNSALNVRHWFGVLVINVFGNWFGSVNEDTAAGEPEIIDVAAPSANSPASSLSRGGVLAAIADGGAASQNQPAAKLLAGAAATTVLAATEMAPALAPAGQLPNWAIIFMASALLMLLAGALVAIEKRLKGSQT